LRMLLRTVVGACAGALAGTGFALTVDWHRQYCYLSVGRTGCGDSGVLLLPLLFVFWLLVAGGLIYAGIGSGLWVVLLVAVVWFKTFFLDLPQEDGHLFLMQAAVITAGVAYLIAAVTVGRARPC
jgi:hypothetical protein